MGDASFMVSASTSMMNIGCQSSLQRYTVEGPYRSSTYTPYSETGSLEEYFGEQQPQHIITGNIAMPTFSNGYPCASSSHQTNVSGQYHAHLKILEQPVHRMRYRYASEKGTHGALQGINSTSARKTYPKVQLENAPQQTDIYVQASLYTVDNKLHVHKLTVKSCVPENGYCRMKLEKDSTATFPNLGIMFTGKKDIPEVLFQRKYNEMQTNDYHLTLTAAEESNLRDDCRREAKSMDVNKVVLCFQAFDEKTHHPVCDKVFSHPVLNQKSLDAGELKIVKISRSAGSCTGNDEVFLLCEKVNKKEIKIRFYKEENGTTVWEEFAQFQESDVHHQVAIVFRTPPYRDEKIDAPVQVYFQLFRQKDEEASESLQFMYTPIDRDRDCISQKRRKVECDDRYSSASFPHNQYPSISTSEEMKHSNMPSTSYGPGQLQGSPPYQTRGRSIQEDLNDIADLMTLNVNPPFVNVVSSSSEVPNPVENTVVGNIADEEIPFQDLDDTPHIRKNVFMGCPSGYESDGLRNQSCIISNDENIEDEMMKPSDSSSRRFFSHTHITVESCLRYVARALSRFLAFGSIQFLIQPLQRLMEITDEDGDNAIHYIAVSDQRNTKHSDDVLRNIFRLPLPVLSRTNKEFQTPLQLAIAAGNHKVIKCLLERGVDPNIQDFRGCSAIHLSVIKHDHDCLDLILRSTRRRLNMNLLNYNGLAPIHVAIQTRCKECVLKLCTAGCDINRKDGTSGKTALHMAVEYFPQIIDDLLRQMEIKIDSQDYAGNTALHLACTRQNLDVALKLIKKKANPFIENCQKRQDDENEDEETCRGMTPYDYAESNEMLKRILTKRDYDESESRIEEHESKLGMSSDEIKDNTDFNRDSGFISGEIDSTQSESRIQLCEALDPPNTEWEKLAAILCDGSHIPYLRKNEAKPSSTLLKGYSDTEIEELLTIAGLEKYAYLLK